MPSLSFEMLRLASGSDTIVIKSTDAGITSVAVKGFALPTDLHGQIWVHFARYDPSIYVSAVDVLEGKVNPDVIAGRLVLIGTSAAGLLDVKTTPISPVMPGVEIHAQVLEAALTGQLLSQPPWGPLAEFLSAHDPWRRDHLVCAEVRAEIAGRRRRLLRDAAGGNLLVLLFAAPAPDRFHLSVAVDHRDLPDADFLQLRPRAGAAAADPLGVRPVSVAGAGRAARTGAGETGARRRGARDDRHVQRHEGIHLDLGNLQERPARPDRADEPFPDAAHQRDPRSQGHHRQIHGRRHHGVLERAARRQGASDQRLRSSARHAGAGRRAQQGARGGSAGGRPRRIFRSTSASA